MEIVKYPDKRLLYPSREVNLSQEHDFLQRLVDGMFSTMECLWGYPVGLAAPQVGENVRLFIALGEVYVNPRIVWKSSSRDYHKEGCYSLEKDKYDYGIWRPQSIRLQWYGINGEKHEQRFNGRKSQVIQHENDHLEGRLCCGGYLNNLT